VGNRKGDGNGNGKQERERRLPIFAGITTRLTKTAIKCYFHVGQSEHVNWPMKLLLVACSLFRASSSSRQRLIAKVMCITAVLRSLNVHVTFDHY